MNRMRWLCAVAMASLLPVLSAARAVLSAEGDVAPLVNPGFEADADNDGLPDGWVLIAGDGGKSALSLDRGHTGERCAKVVCEEMKGRWGPGIGQDGTVAVAKGKSYRVSFWAKGEGADRLTVGLHDTSDWRHCGLWNSEYLDEDWRKHEVIFDATKTCSKTTRLQFVVGEEGTFRLDDVKFEEIGPPPNPALFDVTGAKNLVPNASFELGPAGWGTWGADELFGEVDATTAAHGACSFKIALAPDRYPVYYNDYDYKLHGNPSHRAVTDLPLANVGWFPLKEGAPYTLSVWLKSDTPGLAVRAAVRQWPYREAATQFQAGADWARHVFTFTAQRNSGFVTIAAELKDPARDRAALWIDAIQVERGGQATPFEPMRPVEIASLTDKPGNIFHLGEEVALDVRLFNNTAAAARASAQATVTDFFDRPVHEEAMAVEAPPGAAARKRLVPPIPDPGFYRLHLRLQGDGYTQEKEMRYAVIFPYSAAYPGTDSQFGINHAFISDSLMRLAREAGVRWVRGWFLKWDDVEPEKGKFDFSEADAQLDRLLRLGCRVEVCLSTPSNRWATTAPADLKTDTGGECEWSRHWWLPASFDDYENYVFRAVEHGKGRVRHWEVFNEPHDGKGGPNANLDLKANYVKFLERARAGARRADPSALILGAGYDYVGHAYESQKALESVEIISEHAYPGLERAVSWQKRLDGLAGKFEAAGGAKPIWMTEYGVYADDDPDPSTAQSRFMARLGKAGEMEAATHVAQHYVIALGSGVEKIFFHIGNWPWMVNQEHVCGFHMFFEYGGTPRKTYVTHSVLAWMLGPEAKFHRRIEAGPMLFAYEFHTPKQATIAAWRAKRAPIGEPLRAALCAEGVEVRNVAGKDVRQELRELGNSPVYFRCAVADAEKIAQALRQLREP